MSKRQFLDQARQKFLEGIGVPPQGKFEIDDFQREAISSVVDGKDTLVVAPTGSGKTYIALEAIRAALLLKKRAVYTTPLKALSNTKYNELKLKFEPDYKVGILTGDRKIESDADVVVATTEIYRNELYRTEERYSMVVLDEVHFIADPQRGPVWEESIILTPRSTTLLMLSASISNVTEIAEWIENVRGQPCHTVIKKERPVELRYGFLHPDMGVMPLADERGGVFREVLHFYGNMGLDSSGNAPPRQAPRGSRAFPEKRSAMMLSEYPVHKVLGELGRNNLLPAILFRTSRKQCDNDIERLMSSNLNKVNAERQASLQKEIDTAILKYGMERHVITSHPHYEALVATATGAHHAGQLLIWRLLLEELMTKGALRLLIATGTVAAGVDFPARTVVVTAHSKRGAEGFNVLTSSEFQQMSGRAGRRGKDAVGICLIAPSVYSDARVLYDVTKRPPEPLRSAYFAAPATVLNLLKHRNVDDLRYTVSRSLASFLDRKSAKGLRNECEQESEQIAQKPDAGDARKKAEKRLRRKQRDADVIEQRQAQLLELSLEGLTKLGYVEGSGLTEKGAWAANLCTSLVLELGEAIHSHLLTDRIEEELAALVGSLAGDPHRAYLSIRANPIKKEHYRALQQIVERVRNAYQNPATTELAVIPEAGLTVLTWMECETWEEFSGLLRLSGVAEGDVARLVTQTADHLNQISRLRESHPELAERAQAVRKRLLKPPLSETTIAVAE